MSHTAYPNNYQLPSPQFPSYQQPQHAGSYVPNPNTATYPNDIYEQDAPPSSWNNASQNNSQRPTVPQLSRPPSAQAQHMDLTSALYSPIHVQSPYAGTRPAPPTRAGSVFSHHGQQGPAAYPPVLNQQSPTRRPLPTPHARPVTNPVPDRRPLPSGYQVSPSAPSTPFHRPSYSTSAAPTSSAFSIQSSESTFGSPITGAPSSTRSSRPLPTPTPRSTKSVDLARSSSPVKDILESTGPLPPPGQRFVPLWKRSLPTAPQSSDRSPAFRQSITTTGFSDDGRSAPGLQRSGSAVRPLPPSPVQTNTPTTGTPYHSPSRTTFSRDNSVGSQPSSPHGSYGYDRHRVLPGIPQSIPNSMSTPSTPHKPHHYPILTESPPKASHSPQSSESEDMYENSLLQRPPRQSSMMRPPSPSFGSREPPSRSSLDQQRPVERDSGHPSGAPRTRRMSIVSRMAEMSLNGSSPDLTLAKTSASVNGSPAKREYSTPVMNRPSTQTSNSHWPVDLPPLPRTPQIQYDQDYAPSGQSSPTRSQPSQAPPPPPQSSVVSPTRSRFLPQTRSRDTSPSQSTPQAPLGSLPPNDPSSPTRPRFPPQAPPRDPALPAPQAQRIFPSLDDAPPPSLRRSPSPMRASTLPPLPSANILPTIRTQNVASRSGSTTMSPPSSVTPSSPSSAFSLSAFPAPPQMIPQWKNNGATFGSSSGSGFRSASPTRRNVPVIAEPQQEKWNASPSMSVSRPEHRHEPRIPKISFPVMDDDDGDTVQIPVINIDGSDVSIPQISFSDEGAPPPATRRLNNPVHPLPTVRNKGGLFCGGCSKAILGRSINTMGANWHPGCFRCASCDQLLENLAMFEHEHRLYCSLCYYENFAPRCYHCQTEIADQDYITLSEADELGKRTYHTQHFFCAECGDPFLPPSSTSRSFAGDGTFDSGAGEGFTVYNGHPYCERCHVRLRMPKCKKCKKPIRKDMDALEVLGGKWCPECFVCKACEGPFINGRFFLRDEKPFCQHCFEIIIKSEL
ncbi:hypothetical protein PHLGIDRAFT_124316 [Phlebiopsis gigantea 11061_1 CR5-6]|uniref:LIM zinc-binding domain-containing protein n=1 Tax=Phlebiopsis gigantea (strain 11061_1 CR5-6) TaxID=745531 RepID=A0A0C3PW14_PHLG1|nr:hypothetical protein PHLGIDRAFT_124316 [Phlebiopsis gigantea 11061_1 CR5-6]